MVGTRNASIHSYALTTHRSVHSYNVQDACLSLRDHYPATAKHTPTALVTIENLLLDGLEHDLLETGAWLNVIGYVRARPSGTKVSKRSWVTYVEAVMVWSAGAIKLEKYNAAIDELQAATNEMRNGD